MAILDEKCHLCLVDGVKLANAKLRFFTHNDPAALDDALQKSEGRRRLVVIEGIYSMDGDMARLPELLEVTERHGVGVMIDEAHSILALGKHGRGCAEHFGLSPKSVGLQYATFSKSFAHTGSFVAGNRELIKYLRHYINGYAFSCALPPVIVAGILKGLEIATRDNSLREKLWANVRHFQSGAESMGLNLGEANSHVFPIIIGSDRQMLYEQCIAMNDAGLFLAPGELPDHLTVVLEYASTQPPEQARAFLGEIAHILQVIFSALLKRESAYASVLAAVLDLAGEKAQAVKIPDEPAIDDSWEEPMAFDGCSTQGQARPGQPQPIQIVKRAAAPTSSGART